MLIADVAVPLPLRGAFSYEVTPEMALSLVPGARVLCDFGKRQIMGVVLAIGERAPEPGVTIKPLRAVIENAPVLSREMLDFAQELAAYYLAPIGEVMRLAVPAVERKRVEDLKAQGELYGHSALKNTKHVTAARETIAIASNSVEAPGSLRGQARELLALLRAGGPLSLSRLEERFSNARPAAKRLEALGLVTLELRDKALGPTLEGVVARDVPPELTTPQTTAVDSVVAAVRGERDKRAFLLFGVTGSGKTEVYLRAIAACLDLGRGALVMVPEIALTPQLVGRFRARFGDDVAVIHSALPDRARHEMHMQLLAGKLRVAIGARSALFAPVPSLGLVIVDEEHDGSFKQEEGVRYHARDMALLRAHRAGATIVLGSATPSLESFELARREKLELLRLPGRATTTAVLPDVTVIDLKRVGPGPSGNKLVTLPLHRALDETLAKQEQAIIFLNRRGHSPTILCGSCGTVATCKACSVSLTFHLSHRSPPGVLRALDADGLLHCHYCGYKSRLPKGCEACSSPELLLEGLGTEKLEEVLSEAFPSARVARLDRDVAEGKKGERILARMRDREIDILVGTQMVTKGHDYPFVTFVGVVNADTALGLPDFRAAERAFSLLVQVAGRAGRHERKGRVFIQTYQPEHPAIRFAKRHDVEGFLLHELGDRREVGYPPFARLALVRVDAIDPGAAAAAAEKLAAVLRRLAPVRSGAVEVLGPAPAPLARLRGRYRHRIMLRAKERPALRAVFADLQRAIAELDRQVRAVIDVDPVSML